MNDVRYALRQLVKSPGFTVVAVLTLALAIGANSAVFSLVNALLVRSLPYKDPAALVLVWEQFRTQGLDRIPVSAPEYTEYEKRLQSFERIAAFKYESFNLSGEGNPERIQGAVVSPSLFDLLGVQPVRGRTFAMNETGAGRDDVVVISAGLWQRRFNSDPTIIGNKITLNGRGYTVIGVAPLNFEFPLPLFNVQGNQFAERADIWKPVAFTESEMKARGWRGYSIIARLPPRVSKARAQAEIDSLVAEWERQFPDNYASGTGFGAKIYPLQDQVVGGIRKGLVVLLGAVSLVLLIACANLATMMLARASARERELAIRVALGASPSRLVRHLLTESVVIALFGGVAGVLLAIWGLDLLRTIGAQTVPRLREVNLDGAVLLTTLIVSVISGIIFGLVPALTSANPELTETLKEDGRGSTSGARRSRLRNSLVVAEVSLALVLLVGAGLLLKSFVRLQNVNPGFDPNNVATMELALPATKYPPGKPVADFYAELVRRIKAIPGVQHAGVTSILPLSGSNSDSSFIIEGRPLRQSSVYPDEEIRIVSPEYFRVLQTSLLHGRFFSDADSADAPGVAIVNQAFVRKYWPNEDAIGKRFAHDESNPKWLTIVGVVADMKHRGMDVDPVPEQYLPHAQRPEREMILAVRSEQPARILIPIIRREVQAFDPDQPIANIRTLDQVISDSVAPRRLSVVLLSVFATIALLLTAVGTYGVISYLVVQRTHEIGVRMALGAQRSDVLRLVVGHALKLVGIGTVIGLILAFLSTRLLSSLLYSVGAFDVATFLFVTITLAVVGLVASYIPALRAARADPIAALGHNA